MKVFDTLNFNIRMHFPDSFLQRFVSTVDNINVGQITSKLQDSS